jgi:hypothetical protein
MVSTRLVDGRADQSWSGWSLYRVEVHQGPLAPFAGLDRMWKRFERVDTIPYIRTLGSVAVVGDTMVIGVGGYSATSFQYDLRTKTLSRAPLPDWLNTAIFTPPPALAPQGRYIAYLGQLEDGTVRFTVRSWPEGRVIAQSAPVHPRILAPPNGGAIWWQNAEGLYAGFPVSDSGPGWARVEGKLAGGRMDLAWTIFPDVQTLAARAVQPVVPVDSAADRPREDQWARAARLIRRLPPSSFPELPQPFAAELARMGCAVPQSGYTGRRGNVIRGSFGAPGQQDWAALCSRNGVSVILLYWGGPAQCPRELAPSNDSGFLQTVGGGRIGFSRGINTINTYHEYPDEDDSTSVDRDMTLEHDGIDDAFEGKASTVRFCRDGKWISFSGAD